jgi:hypothetical protein
MTPSERQRLFNRARGRIARQQVGLMAGTRDYLAVLLEEADTAVATLLASQPSDYQRWSLPQLRAEIRQAMAELADKGGARISSAAGDGWELGEALVDEPIDTAFPGARLSMSLPRIDTTQLGAMRTFMVDRIKDVAAEASGKIGAELGLVAIGARSPSEAISAVTQILGESSRKRATTIVRTELGRVFSSATQLRLKAASARLPGLKKQWRRSGKLHPRLHHDLADGQIQDVDKPFVLKPLGKPVVELMYPRDPAAPAGETINCGCMSIPFMESWEVKHPGRVPGSPLLDDQPVETLAEITARWEKKAKQPA